MTIDDADCSCSVICDIMNKEIRKGDWMIESNVALSNGKLESAGIVQFWRNKEAILVEYQSGFGDEVVPVDIVFLHDHLKENGWNFVISEELVESDGEMWDRFFSIVNDDDDIEDDLYEKNEADEDEDEYGDDEDFLDNIKKTKEYKRPTANKYNMLSIKEFENHDTDMKNREKIESDNKF
jgi:hypothetical protein